MTETARKLIEYVETFDWNNQYTLKRKAEQLAWVVGVLEDVRRDCLHAEEALDDVGGVGV